MRVTIEHREEISGLTNTKKDTYIDCNVIFSEEEKAIIKERDLYGSGFTIRTSTPLPSKTFSAATIVFRLAGVILVVVSLLRGIYEALAHVPTYSVAWPLFLSGAALGIWGWWRGRKEDNRFESDEQTVSIAQLLSKPRFTVHAWNPAAAKGLDQQVRENLTNLKNLIQDSAGIKERQSFEL